MLRHPPFYPVLLINSGIPGGSVVKNLPANAGDAKDMDAVLGQETSPGEGNDNPL